MRLALGVEYDGGAFSGYQQQSHAPSVQQTLQQALSRIADHPVQITAAGRTDAGVHATGQVVSFESNAPRPIRAWIEGANSLLPDAVDIHWAQPVGEDFHPRFDATARRYMYLFYEDTQPSPFLERFAVRSRPLDDGAMHRSARTLCGEQDYSAFRAAGCQSRTPFRCIHRVSVQRAECFVIIDISANAFLLHMVRNIAGSLWQVGLGLQQIDWIEELLRGRDRSLAAPTAPPQGLYLVEVSYPDRTLPRGRLPGVLRALGGLDRF